MMMLMLCRAVMKGLSANKSVTSVELDISNNEVGNVMVGCRVVMKVACGSM